MTNEIVISPKNKLMTMLKSEAVKERFIEVAGRSSGSWITGIINAANLNPVIWECEPISVIAAGLNAAMLRLSLDGSTGQAAILPFSKSKNVNGQWIKEKKAVFVPMVRGLKQLALRTHQYRYINATEVYEGEFIEEKRMTGIQYLKGKRTGNEIIGFYAAFELISGLVATNYMTKEEAIEHGKEYSPTYNKREGEFYKSSKWATDPNMMCKKSVLRGLLLHDGLLDPGDRLVLESPEHPADIPGLDENIIDVEVSSAGKSENEVMAELGIDVPEQENDPAWDMDREAEETPAKTEAADTSNGIPASWHDAIIKAGSAQNEFAVKGALAKCEPRPKNTEAAVAWMRLYRAWRDVGVDPDPSAKKANAGETP